MLIEKATSTGIPVLSDLSTVLFSQEPEFTPHPEARRKGLARVIGDPQVGSIPVARREGQAAGVVDVLFTVSTAPGERVALPEDMVVSAAGRGAGAGTEPLRAAIAFARAQGCKRMTPLTDRDDVAARKFHAKRGFVASTMRPMGLSLA